jgi:hypothetical protein
MNQSLTAELSQVMPQAVATGLFLSLCTIQQRAISAGEPKTDVLGQVDLSGPDYTTVAGLANIPCQIAVQKTSAPDMAAVVRREQQYDTRADKHVLLNAYYPAILQQHIAIVDGVTYEIMAVENDSQQQMTRLAVRVFTL